MNQLYPSQAWTNREARVLAYRNGGPTAMPTGPRDYRYQSAHSMLTYQDAVTRGYVDRLRNPVGQRAGRTPQNYQGYAARHPHWNPATAGRMNYAAYGNGIPTYYATHMGYAPGGGQYGAMGINYHSGAIGGGATGFYGGGYGSYNAMQYGRTGLATGGFGYNPMMGAMSMGGYQPNGLQQGFGMNADGMNPRQQPPAYYPPAPYQRTSTPGLYTANAPGQQYAMNTGFQNPNYGQDYGQNFYAPRPIGQYLTGVQQQYNPYIDVAGAPLYGQQVNASTRQAMYSSRYGGAHTYTWDQYGNQIHYVPPQQTYRGAQRRTAPNNGGSSQTPNQAYNYQNGGNGYPNSGYTNNGNGGNTNPNNEGNVPLPQNNSPNNANANRNDVLRQIGELEAQIKQGQQQAANLGEVIAKQLNLPEDDRNLGLIQENNKVLEELAKRIQEVRQTIQKLRNSL